MLTVRLAPTARAGGLMSLHHLNPIMTTVDPVEQAEIDARYMSRALELARMAEAAGEVPVGAVIVKDGAIVAEGWNRPISTHDPTAHAEVIAMRAAAQSIQNYRLLDTTLYVTLEPCAMCASAMVHARVKRLVYAATDPRAGASGSIFNITQNSALNHRLDVQAGVMAEECAAALRTFFAARR
jgi:tRNA(adenine34) deaminase